MNLKIDELKFNADGLIPAVVQDYKTKDVLMLAYMNEESIANTLASGYATYWSRSRSKLWKKGLGSGDLQIVESITPDCDKDTLLLIVRQAGGGACHLGTWTCFHGAECFNETKAAEPQIKESTIQQLADTIATRKSHPQEGSYTTYLFNEGVDKILKKVGEEAAEIIIAAKNKGNEELVCEISDLVYHTLVLMAERDISIDEVKDMLKKRAEGK